MTTEQVNPWLAGENGDGVSQTPPEVKIRISVDGSRDLVRIVSMGASLDLGRFRRDHEYIYYRYRSILPDSAVISSSAFAEEEDEASLIAFLGDMIPAIDFHRVDPIWIAGRRTTPEDRIPTLYRLPNPDGVGGSPRGLLLEMHDASDTLEAIVFYRAASTGDLAWASRDFEQPLSFVHSADPSGLDPRVTAWEYTVMENPR